MDMLELYEMDMLRRARGQAGFGYRTADLVLHLDGIQNTRAGTHNPLATVWEDLAGNMDVTLYNTGWGADYASFLGTAASYGVGDYWTFTKGMTVEVVAMINSFGSLGQFIAGWNQYSATKTITKILLQYRAADTAIQMDSRITFTSVNKIAPLLSPFYSGITGGVSVQNGETYIHNQYLYPIGTTNVKFILTQLWGEDGSRKYAGFNLSGRIYAVRVYDANLTAEELYAHWLIDKARFNIPEA